MSKEHYDQLTLHGSELLKHVMSVLVVEVGPIVSDICETIEAPFVIGRSFAAMELINACNIRSSQYGKRQ